MQPIKILIVEDEFIIASHIEEIVKSGGYEVVDIVAKGEAVPGIIVDKNPDLVLMDINLAGQLDGIETAKIISKTTNIPIIFLTSNIDNKSFQRSKGANPQAFLTKPFVEEDLLRNIELVSNRQIFHSQEKENNVPNEDAKYLEYEDSIFVRDKSKMVKLLLKDILYVAAERNYCRIKTTTKDYVLSVPLKVFEEKAAATCFSRIHRSYLANISQIDGFNESYLFFGDEHVPISKTHRQEILSKLNVV